MKHINYPAAYERATIAAIKANTYKTFMKRPDADIIVKWIDQNAERNKFAESLDYAITKFGKLTEGQCVAVLKNIEKGIELKKQWEATKGISSFVGDIKNRLDLSLSIVAKIEMEPYQVAYNTYAYNTLFSMVDDNGNKVVYIGTTDLGSKGDKVSLKATIKEHSVYRGEKQTKINRPKILGEVSI